VKAVIEEDSKILISVHAIIVTCGGKILIIQRPDRESVHYGRGCWEVPGGQVDGTELSAEYLISEVRREIKEEVGLDIIWVIPITVINRFIEGGPRDGDRHFQHFFLCWAGKFDEDDIELSAEHQHRGWVINPEDLASLEFMPNHQQMIESVLANMGDFRALCEECAQFRVSP
jgi:8-oxo-dGTP pyrophosphatase MutT (NUDIX family)